MLSQPMFRKQPSGGVLKKRCSENIQQIYRRTPMPKCHHAHARLRDGCSPVNLLHIFRIPFLRTPLVGCFCMFSIILVCMYSNVCYIS